MKDTNITKAWQLYEEGKLYNNRLVPNQYSVVNTNTEFYNGNQWLHLPQTEAMRRLPHPTFNILGRIGSLFIASLTTSGISVRLSPLAYYDASGEENPDGETVKIANAEIENLLEKFNADSFIHEALERGAKTGDYCAHFYWDPDAMPFGGGLTGKGLYRGEIRMELVDGIDVMFGNPNDRRVEAQPYIIIVGRDTVENLRDEADRWKRCKELLNGGKGPGNPEEIQMDAETGDFIGVGGKTELTGDDNGKALYVILYSRVSHEETMKDEYGNIVYEDVTDDDGNPVYETEKGKRVLDAYGQPVPKRREAKQWVTSIHATKATKTAVLYEDVDTGLTHYPVAWGNWKRQDNQYHGRALVTELIPNQITINTSYAMMTHYMQQMAFPKTVYNMDMIPAWTNEIGKAIGIRNLQPGQSVSTVAYNIPPAQVSGQFFTAVDGIIQYTKECMGATDVQMGNVQPENTSAIAVLTQNSSVPLENIRILLRDWVEQIARILLDMMGNYYSLYGKRPVVFRETLMEPVMGPDGMPVIDPVTGIMQMQSVPRQVMAEFDFTVLKNIELNLRVDVGEGSRYSEAAMLQTLTNLRQDGTLTVLEFLERIPDRYIPDKAKLIDAVREREARGEQANAAAGAAIQQPGSPLGNSAELRLPADIRDRLEDMPNKAQGAIQQALRAG